VTELPVYEFADIRVDQPRMAVWRGGAPVPLEPKSLDILLFLLEHRDRLVTKDELLDTVWRDTFVTPNVLTRAIAQLRRALGDDARGARYIETVSKRGYRFIATVTVAGNGGRPDPDRSRELRHETTDLRHEATDVRRTTEDPDQESVASPGRPEVRRHTATRLAAIAVVIGALVVAALWWTPRPAAPAIVGPALTPSRLTTRLGHTASPAISLDGRAVAYVSDRTGGLEIYVVGLAAGSKEIVITNDGGQNMQPAWSPDGQLIAFHSRKRGGIWVAPSTGGTPRQLVNVGSAPSWAPDGERLAYTADEGTAPAQSELWTVARDGSDRRPVDPRRRTAGRAREPGVVTQRPIPGICRLRWPPSHGDMDGAGGRRRAATPVRRVQLQQSRVRTG
jgi:DNA-binding winged helix-turn-helix (wHTH) protein